MDISQVANFTPVTSGMDYSGTTGNIRPQGTASVDSSSSAVKSVSGTVDISEVKKAAERANNFISQASRDLEFSVDEDTGANIVTVIDTSTKEVIRQIPSPEMLEIAKALDKLQGMIIRQKA